MTKKDKKSNRKKFVLILVILAVVVTLALSFGAGHFLRGKSNSAKMSRPSQDPVPSEDPIFIENPIYDEGKVFLMYDPDCTESDNNKCDLVLFNADSMVSVPISGKVDDPDHEENERYNINPQVSPDGKIIGFSRSNDDINYSSIIFADRNGEKLRKVNFPDMKSGNFSFKPDNQGIIYVGGDEKFIYSADLDGGNKQPLLEIDIGPNQSSLVLLKSGTLVFSRKYSSLYKVCMKKQGDNDNKISYSYDSFNFPPKLIPFGDFVYCVSSDNNVVTKFNTSSGDIDDKKISNNVENFKHLHNGTISEDGKVLYLIASKNSTQLQLLKIDVEGSFQTENQEIEGEIFMPPIKGFGVKLMPILGAE